MKRQKSKYSWIPLWVDKWIFGSTRLELSLEERSIWIDFLALASKDDGYIRANENTPYLTAQLSGLLIIPEDLLKQAIKKFLEVDKLIETSPGIYYVKHWETYKLKDNYKRQIMFRLGRETDDVEEEKTENVTEVTENVTPVTKGITIIYKEKEKENMGKTIKRDNGGSTSRICDQEWISALKSNPAYAGIDIDKELAKMATWCDVNGKIPSRRRFINWLNRVEKPITKEVKDWRG